MRILFFGTYDVRAHPRVGVLMEGLRSRGVEIVEVNEPLGVDTAWRVRLMRQPWLLPVLALRVLISWLRLAVRIRGTGPVDATVVGYLGHLDVHLARTLVSQRIPIVLDHLVSLADTANDRGGAGAVTQLLAAVDRAALSAADVILVDTKEHVDLVPVARHDDTVVVRVGASADWFSPPAPEPRSVVRVIFFGTFTPLHGAETIGRAVRTLGGSDIAFTMVGHGQDLEATRQAVGSNSRVQWIDWVDAAGLPALVSEHHICLGIFGTSPKARRVVPNKVYQGAAAGCAIVTSNTTVQRAVLGDSGVFVPPGDHRALATALEGLAKDHTQLRERRRAARDLAETCFRPSAVVAPLYDRLVREIHSE